MNRNGYFTIRGIKIGAGEIDILAIRPLPNGRYECRHVEVHVAINPIGYITVRGAKKRDAAQLRQGVQEWVKKKFSESSKIELRNRLCAGSWTKELVVGAIKHEDELNLLQKAGVTIHRLKDILAEMGKPSVVRAATGADLYDLMLLRERLGKNPQKQGTS